MMVEGADIESSGKPRAAGRYRKVEIRTWGDAKFRALSPLPPCGQGLWLFLITGPHTGPIPGLFRAGRAAMAEELGWDLEAFDKAFGEAFGQGMVKADFKARVMWVPNGIRHNKPESPNVVRSWAAEFDLIPECPLKREACEALRASIYALGEGYARAFDEAFGKPIGKPSSKPSTKTCPNQEQEQEQEQEGGSASPAGAAGPPPAEFPEAFRTFIATDRPDLDAAVVWANFRDHYLPAQRTDRAWKKWVRREHHGPTGARAAGHAQALTVPGRPGRDPVLDRIEADRAKAVPPSPAERERLRALRHSVAKGVAEAAS